MNMGKAGAHRKRNRARQVLFAAPSTLDDSSLPHGFWDYQALLNCHYVMSKYIKTYIKYIFISNQCFCKYLLFYEEFFNKILRTKPINIS
jgi:hypothetical protein